MRKIVLRVILLIVFIFLTPITLAFNYQYPASLVKVVDGDTIRLNLEVYPRLYQEVDLRIYGVDTPESRHGKKNGVSIPDCEITLGKATTKVAISVLTEADALWVKNIDPKKTKYAGRIVGELWFQKAEHKKTLRII